MENKEILSMQEVDFSKLKMPAIAVYKRPEDFPRKCVARVYDMDKPTEHILINCYVWNMYFTSFFLLVSFNPKYGIFSIAFFFIRPTYFSM